MHRSPLLLLVLLAAPVCGQEPTPPTPPTRLDRLALTAATLEDWRQHITPTAAETGWAKLPWHGSLHAGLTAAAAAKRPLLLWTMNGHPFGCT